jgi:hypothetical protein
MDIIHINGIKYMDGNSVVEGCTHSSMIGPKLYLLVAFRCHLEFQLCGYVIGFYKAFK